MILALGCSLRKDGTAAHPTRWIALRAAELLQRKIANKIILSGGNPVNKISEAFAMLQTIQNLKIPSEDILMDEFRGAKYVGTLDQAKSAGYIFQELKAKRVILVVQPQQMPRALWLFRKLFPKIEFFAANPREAYDTHSTQVRMFSAWHFRLWNMVAWSGLWRNPKFVTKMLQKV